VNGVLTKKHNGDGVPSDAADALGIRCVRSAVVAPGPTGSVSPSGFSHGALHGTSRRGQRRLAPAALHGTSRRGQRRLAPSGVLPPTTGDKVADRLSVHPLPLWSHCAVASSSWRGRRRHQVAWPPTGFLCVKNVCARASVRASVCVCVCVCVCRLFLPMLDFRAWRDPIPPFALVPCCVVYCPIFCVTVHYSHDESCFNTR